MTIELQALPNEIWRVVPSGRLDVAGARAVELALNDLLDSGGVWLVADFSQTAYITSAGLKIFVSAMRRARKLGGDLHLAAMTPRVREIFDMAGFDQVFNIWPTLEEALARLRPGVG